jgi:hypothetical protein
LVVLEAGGRTRLGKAKFFEKLTEKKALLGGVRETDVFGFHAASGDTMALRAGIGEDGCGIFADGDVVAGLAAAVSVNSICCIDVDIESGTFRGVIADAISRSTPEKGKDAKGFKKARRGRGRRASGEELDFFADVGASLEEVDKAANYFAKVGGIDWGRVGRSVK